MLLLNKKKNRNLANASLNCAFNLTPVDVVSSHDDDEDLVVFRAVEEGQALRWSGFNCMR